MKVGTENKFELIVAVVLGVLALAALGYWATSGTTPQVTPTTAAVAVQNGPRPLLNPLDPRLATDLLISSENVKYTGKGRNIFRPGAVQIDIPKPKTPPLDANKIPTPTQPPVYTPPPINLKFFGVATRPGEQPRVLLTEGETVFVAHEGEIVNRRYRIVKINPQSVEVEDILNNNRQSIPLSQG